RIIMDHQDCAVDLSKHTDMKLAGATSPSGTDEKTPKMAMNTYLPIKTKYFKSCNSDAGTKRKIIQDFQKSECSDSENDKMQTGLSDTKNGNSLLPGNISVPSLTRKHRQMTFPDNFPMSECLNSNYKVVNSIRPGSNLPRDAEACSTKTRAFKRKFKSRVRPVVNSLCSSDSNDSCNEEKYHTSQESESKSIEGNTKTGPCEPEDLSVKGSSSRENTDHYSSDTEDYQESLKKVQEVQKRKRGTKGKIKTERDESRLSQDRSLKMKTAESANSLNSGIGDTHASHAPLSGIGNYRKMAKLNRGRGNQQAKVSCNKRNCSEDNSQQGPSQDTEMQNDVLTKKFLEICKAYVEGWSTTYTCTLCNQMFSNKEGLQDHMRYHLREDPQFSSITKDGPKKSKKTWKPRAESKRLHQCHICMKTLTRNWDLQRHIRTHSEPKGTVNFICELCGSGFSDKANYKRHVKGHNEEKKHQCPFCPQLFARRWDLTRHFRIHTGEKEVFCEVCDQGFTRQWDLIRHMRIHTGERPHACHICGKAFIRRWDKDRHLNTHTGERPYQCSLCDKTFVEKTRLLIHEGKHNGRTPFTCHICKKEYLDVGNLTKHLMKHAEEKMYQCQFCPKEFTHKWILDKHARTHYRAFQRQMEKQIKQPGSKNEQDQIIGENSQAKLLDKPDHDQTVFENAQGQSDNSSCDLMQNHDHMEDENFKVQD
ncbi:hypothetical protein CHS0354_033013, partial [Potamilus streckersoni]